jgi:thiamine-phosphate pyrophosphorylase
MAKRCILYYITDRTAFAVDEPARRRLLLQKIGEAARAGIDYIQLREKDLPTRELEPLARQAVAILNELRTVNRDLRTKLLINSRTDVALALGADGVHLRSDDISPQEVSAVWRKSHMENSHVETAVLGRPAPRAAAAASPQPPLIGVSCHSTTEVMSAEANGATFAVFAPVFEKKGRPGQRPAGLVQLREACKAKIPVLALGGVAVANARQCVDVGAAGIAAIRLFQENDMAALVAQLKASL